MGPAWSALPLLFLLPLFFLYSICFIFLLNVVCFFVFGIPCCCDVAEIRKGEPLEISFAYYSAYLGTPPFASPGDCSQRSLLCFLAILGVSIIVAGLYWNETGDRLGVTVALYCVLLSPTPFAEPTNRSQLGCQTCLTLGELRRLELIGTCEVAVWDAALVIPLSCTCKKALFELNLCPIQNLPLILLWRWLVREALELILSEHPCSLTDQLVYIQRLGPALLRVETWSVVELVILKYQLVIWGG